MTKLAIFDLDGTLLCTHRHLYEAILRGLKILSLPPVSLETVLQLIYDENIEAGRKHLPRTMPTEMIYDLFRPLERKAMQEHATLYEGALDLLHQLLDDGFQLAICSNECPDYIDLALECTGIRELFAMVMSSHKKPKTDTLRNLLLQLAPDFAVFVGDRLDDFVAGRVNHIPTVAAAYGYGKPFEWEQATYRADSPKEVYGAICKALCLCPGTG